MTTGMRSYAGFCKTARARLTNNPAERSRRTSARGKNACLFAGSDYGSARAAAMYLLIPTAKLNNVDPRAWLADVLRWINVPSGIPA